MGVTANRKYMIYFRDGRYLVCEESFGNYVKPEEVVKGGIPNSLDAEIEAGYMQCKMFTEQNNKLTVRQFPNPTNNEWINKYNALVIKIKSEEAHWKAYKKTQPKRNDKNPDCWKNSEAVLIHHIIPKSINASLIKENSNLLYVPFNEHITLHYYLWKANPAFAKQLWWIYIAGRKLKRWELPGGEEEFKQLKMDLKK